MNDSSDFDRIALKGVEAVVEWRGACEIRFGESSVLGEGILNVDTNRQTLSVTVQETTHPTAANFPGHGNLRVGEILPPEAYGTAAALNNDWRAEDALQTGMSWSAGGSAAGTVTEYTLGNVFLRGLAAGEATFYRHVYQGGDIPNATSYTVQGDGTSFDRMSSSFRGRRFDIRRLTDERAPLRSVVAAIHDGAPLSDVEETAVWLTVCYLSGTRIKDLYADSFDQAGRLVERRYQLGGEVGARREQPFSATGARLTNDGLKELTEGFATLLERRFPIDRAVQHVLDAAGQSIDTEVIHLLFAIQVIVSAVGGLVPLDSVGASQDWDISTGLKRSGLDRLESSLGRPSEGSARKLVGFRNQVLATMNALRLVPSTSTSAALQLRNELFHVGYLPTEGAHSRNIQRSIDAARALRNLANALILRAAGFNADFTDARSFGRISLNADLVEV